MITREDMCKIARLTSLYQEDISIRIRLDNLEEKRAFYCRTSNLTKYFEFLDKRIAALVKHRTNVKKEIDKLANDIFEEPTGELVLGWNGIKQE